MRTLQKLGSVIADHGGLIQTGPFGSQLHQRDYVSDGIPVVMPKDIVAGRIDNNGVARVSEQKAHELARHTLRSGNIVFPRRGDINKCALINGDEEGYLCGTGCLKVEVPQTHIPRFIYYYLSLPQTAQWLENNAVGTTMLNLNTSILGRLDIPVVRFAEQQRIVDVLGAYDDLIENNRRRIQLLEESARLLYREWFVYLRFPGHEHTKIVDGVPEGWERKMFEHVCDTVGGGTPSTKVPDFWDGDISWVTPSDVTRSEGIYLVDTEKKITESGLRNSSAKILPDNAILMTSRASIGFFALANRKVCTNQGFISVVPRSGYSREFFIFHLMSRVDEFQARASGSTFKELSKGKFRKLFVVWPSEIIQREFSMMVRDQLMQIEKLALMNQKLQRARDILLPRLMSGDLTV